MRSLSTALEPPSGVVPNEINPVVPLFSLLLITKPPPLYFTKSPDVVPVPSLWDEINLRAAPESFAVSKFWTSKYLKPAVVTAVPMCTSPSNLTRNLSRKSVQTVKSSPTP